MATLNGAEQLGVVPTGGCRRPALCEAISARNEPGVPHDEFMASLDLKS
jgi:hypothetical protein